MNAGRFVWSLAVLLLCGACQREVDPLELLQSPEAKERQSRFLRTIAERKSGSDDGTAVARWFLPASLNEVSGLALSADGRLFAHGDEGGTVATIDYRSGVLIKEFIVGKLTESIDFEGIAIINDTLLMITSAGDLYEFREGSAGEEVEYAIHKMGLEKECEFEGVAYDPAIASVLLACKNVKNEALQDSLVIFRWKLRDTTATGPVLTRLAIPLSSVTAPIQSKEMHPSDLAVDPSSGNYVMICAQERALLEITPTGVLVYVRRIDDSHEQAEGLAVTRDSLVIIADEAVRTRAVLTLYRKPS